MKYLKILANWRIMTITALAVLSIALMAGDNEDLLTLACCKASGVIIACMAFRLAEAWNGKMTELDIFSEP